MEKGDSKSSLKDSPPNTSVIKSSSGSSVSKKDSKSADKKAENIPEHPKELSASSDSFDTSDEEEVIKPAIQVVIRDKPIELQKTNSLFNIDPSINLSKPVAGGTIRGTQTLKARGTRASNRFTMDPDIFNTLQPLQPLAHAVKPVTASNGLQTTPPIGDNTSSGGGGGGGAAHASSNQKLNNESIESMKQCIAKLESGEFKESIQEVDHCISTLLSMHSPNPANIQNEINFCVGYKVALNLLIEINNLEQKVQSEYLNGNSADTLKDYYDRLSLLSKWLVDIPTQNSHRVICAKMAIHYNMISGNYGVAGHLLETLQKKNINSLLSSSTSAVSGGGGGSQHDSASHSSQSSNGNNHQIEEKLSQCRSHNFENHALPMYICPTCKSSSTQVDQVQCSCSRSIRWCFSTFELIRELSFLQCNFCNSIFSINQSDNIPNKQCTFCNHGQIIHNK